jgi:RNA polymerase sigma factor (TIGR02999 family)
MVRDDEQDSSSPDEPAATTCPSDAAASDAASGDVTRILSAIEEGDGSAAEQLLPVVYDELRKLAAAKMAQENPGQTLQATALVHEAYLRLVNTDQDWDSRRHFFAAAAEAMRRILVERARHKERIAAGGEYQRVELSQVAPEIAGPELDILAVNDALCELARVDPRAAELVNLRFFVGLTNQEAAKALGISVSTAYADWNYAKSWLRVALLGAPPADATS